ncbi:MAG: RNA 2',3'-cyclic phosphodiesterase [Actinomycetota bacterium]|nr:RNA 2',3'-cyclic phosphodiesterase [Actinomycetota bacterium]
MDGKSAQTPRARLFVALDLPEEVRRALGAWGAKAGEASGGTLRAVPPQNLHLTLAFLGAREEAEVPAIGAIVTATAGATPHLSLGAPLWLPPRRPGVLTVEVDDHTGALNTLHASLTAALQAGAAFMPETRPFRPHITVGRVPRGHRIRPQDTDLSSPPSATIPATALILYRSRAGRYEPLARRALL